MPYYLNLTKLQHMEIFQVQKIKIDRYYFYGWHEDHQIKLHIKFSGHSVYSSYLKAVTEVNMNDTTSKPIQHQIGWMPVSQS